MRRRPAPAWPRPTAGSAGASRISTAIVSPAPTSRRPPRWSTTARWRTWPDPEVAREPGRTCPDRDRRRDRRVDASRSCRRAPTLASTIDRATTGRMPIAARRRSGSTGSSREPRRRRPRRPAPRPQPVPRRPRGAPSEPVRPASAAAAGAVANPLLGDDDPLADNPFAPRASRGRPSPTTRPASFGCWHAGSGWRAVRQGAAGRRRAGGVLPVRAADGLSAGATHARPVPGPAGLRRCRRSSRASPRPPPRGAPGSPEGSWRRSARTSKGAASRRSRRTRDRGPARRDQRRDAGVLGVGRVRQWRRPTSGSPSCAASSREPGTNAHRRRSAPRGPGRGGLRTVGTVAVRVAVGVTVARGVAVAVRLAGRVRARSASSASAGRPEVDRSLLDILPADIDGVPSCSPTTKRRPRSTACPRRSRRSRSRLYIQPGSSTADDLAIANIVRLRPGVFDETWFRVVARDVRRRRVQGRGRRSRRAAPRRGSASTTCTSGLATAVSTRITCTS